MTTVNRHIKTSSIAWFQQDQITISSNVYIIFCRWIHCLDSAHWEPCGFIRGGRLSGPDLPLPLPEKVPRRSQTTDTWSFQVFQPSSQLNVMPH